jgi:cyanophycin synthetase
MADEGDLVVLFVDQVSRCWNQVIHYEGHVATVVSAETSKPAHSFVEADPEAFSMDSGVRLVRDERGVRVAREEESD